MKVKIESVFLSKSNKGIYCRAAVVSPFAEPTASRLYYMMEPLDPRDDNSISLKEHKQYEGKIIDDAAQFKPDTYLIMVGEGDTL